MLGILFLAVLMLVTCCLFLLGANSENLICDPLKRPNRRPDVIQVHTYDRPRAVLLSSKLFTAFPTFKAVQRFLNLQEQNGGEQVGRMIRDTKLRWILEWEGFSFRLVHHISVIKNSCTVLEKGGNKTVINLLVSAALLKLPESSLAGGTKGYFTLNSYPFRKRP